MSKWLKTVWAVVLLSGLLVLLSACAGGGTEDAPDSMILEPVKSEAVVVAEGVVLPVRYTRLSFPVSGVVEEILISEGQTVEKDEVIAKLEGSERLEAAITTAELAVLTAQQNLDDLYENEEIRRSEAQLALANAQDEYDDALEDRDDLNQKHGNQSQIDGAYAEYILAEQAVVDAANAFSDVAHFRQNDPIRAAALSQWAAARDARDRALRNYNYLNSPPDEIDIAEADGRIEVALAALEKAEKDWEELKDGVGEDELALAEARFRDAEAQLANAKASLSDIELTAPHDGVVITSALKVGELVGPTLPVVNLADVSDWQVETTDLTELSVVDVQPGTSVVVTFDAVPGLELSGEVAKIKSLGENRQGDITYTVVIDLLELDDRLRWNMTAFVVFDENE